MQMLRVERMETMNTQNIKKYTLALALGAGFGLTTFTTANAQNYQRRQDRREVERRGDQRRNDANYGPVDSNGNIDRNRNGIDDRYEVNGQVDINQNGIPDSAENLRRDRGYNGNNGAFGNHGYNNSEFQQGYRAGQARGREDAYANRRMNFNNSTFYRNGNAAYRAGFEQGCNEAFQQYRFHKR